MTEDSFDVIIVGGGSAGLSAALVLSRARRKVAVIDAGLPRNRFAAHMHGFLTRDGIPPLELLELGRAEVVGYGATIVQGRAEAVSGSAGAFAVSVVGASGADETGPRILTGRRLVIATGLTDELPAIPGLAEQWGRGAFACPYCDGWENRDSRIAVLATGPQSAHQASLLRQWSSQVAFVGPQAASLDAETRRGFEARGIEIVDTALQELVADEAGELVGLRLGDGSVREFDVVFAGPRMVNNDALLDQLGAAKGDAYGEWVASDFTGLTSVPGVWVAGNAAFPGALVPVAVAAGVMAATMINADLVGDDTRQAVEALERVEALDQA
ncbi:NAD(P)/FAD-dependent oxidoreductase [Herbiconiux sp. A18JL235]|uniref:NAD(P)/FAD-dependent oxidoreductase n=1 Tax=Herbiconiux sp. A18JL235 TaxID=3152363 RepID=A0AB39BFN8_9MICO